MVGQVGESRSEVTVRQAGGRKGFGALLLASTIMSSATMLTPAIAQQAAPAATSDRAVSFNIPAQPLRSAISAFIRTTGWQVGYPGGSANTRTSHAVSGTMSPMQALQTLLGGTGLRVQATGPTTVALVDASTASNSGAATVPGAINLDTINVQGDQQSPYGPGVGYVATRSTAGSKTNTPIIETPQSISVVTRKQMDDQQPEDLNQALRYTPGIVPEQYGVAPSANYTSNLTLRGFSPDVYLDGLKTSFGARVDPYLLNRAEVVGGPASVLYGQASPGGLVNMGSRLPTDTPIHELQFGVGSYGKYLGSFDLGGPIDPNGQFLYRLTGVGFTADSQVDFTKTQEFAIAPAITWRPDGDTSFTVLGKYINTPGQGAYASVPAFGSVLPNPNGKIPTSFFSGDPNYNSNPGSIATIGYQFEHRFDDVWSVRQNFRYEHSESNFEAIYPSGLEPDLETLDRYAFRSVSRTDGILLDNQVAAKFSTGPVSHQVTLGLDYQNYSYNSKSGFDFSTSPINIFAPAYGIPAPSIPDDSLGLSVQHQYQVGLYAQDQITLERLHVLAGARGDWASTDNTYTCSGCAPSVTKLFDRAPTWRVGATYLFDNGIAPYVSYSTSFQPNLGTTFDGAPYVPTTAQQYEAGIKYQPPGSNSFFTAAIYDLTEQNVAVTDPAHPGYSTQTGEIRARGLELQGHASLTDRLDLIATYTYTDAINTKSTTFDTTIGGLAESTEGKRPVAVPTNMASLWGDYTIHDGSLRGFGFGGGVRYVGSAYGDDVNSFKVSGFALVDAAFHYDFGEATPTLKGLKLQVNVNNLFDKQYVSSCFAGYSCYYGLRRTIYATLKYDW